MPSNTPETLELGTVRASEQLLRDLYVDLRQKTRAWASITKQTTQARMGYVGQHLASVVTGYPGGRSGARGKDLILSGGDHAEIKTCYRVDQLGKCLDCNEVVASIELHCESCGSENIRRNDDSKWLISIRDENELRELFTPRWYLLVLFDFEDVYNPTHINARVWRVDPTSRGFSYCMVDYYFNIRAKSKSKAPFNLWPFQLKFDIMKAELIYHAQILPDDSIRTLIHSQHDEPSQRIPTLRAPQSLDQYSQSQNLTEHGIAAVAAAFSVDLGRPQPAKKQSLRMLEDHRRREGWREAELADVLAEALYKSKITEHLDRVPLPRS